MVLAYLHHYTCNFLPKRCLAASHLNHLAGWIGQPVSGLRSARAHKPLAAHLALLHAAGLLATAGGVWTCTPAAFAWLKATHAGQLAALLNPLLAATTWQQTVTDLGLAETLSLDYTAYCRQMLERQRQAAAAPAAPAAAEKATWIETPDPELWLLGLPEHLPTAVLFDLLQLGHWRPGQPLRCTPVTVAEAARRGYSAWTIENLISQATGTPLPAARQEQLWRWLQRLDVYQVRPVYLLSTRQPGQLAEIAAVRRLHNRFHQQIGPRHALVSADIMPSLRRWLAKRGYLLTAPASEPASAHDPDAAYTWLGLRLLVGLAGVIELPFRAPHSSLALAAGNLSSQQLAEYEAQAQAILADLQAAIRGRDAFFPAEQPVPAELAATIQEAINAETHLFIAYQSLVDRQPHYRRVEPHRLEQRGELAYLHAYCYLAEADRVFRLDRIHSCQILAPDEGWET